MKYYIVIDNYRKIIARQLELQNLLNGAVEVTKEVFDTSIQENHNYLNEDLTTCFKEYEKTKEELNSIRKSEIYAELESIDTKTIRPLRAILNGLGTDSDKAKLTELEIKSTELRTELLKL